MKAKFLIPMKCVPSAEFPGDWECSECDAKGRGPRLKKCPECGARVRQKDGVKPAGTVVEHRQAWLLVRQGVAVPVDEACRRRSNMTPEQMEEAAYAYERTTKGIHPDDFAAYDAGLMDGYDANGEPIPGPALVNDIELEVEDEPEPE